MNTLAEHKKKAEQFHQLHHNDELLMLPNIWDILGAKLLEEIGYPAIATASASIALTNGYNDGEKIPFDHLLGILKRISNSVLLPVTADIEGGFAKNDIQFRSNIKNLIETGIVGINFEDTDHHTGSLVERSTQCRRIQLIRSVADEMGIPLFINARTDVLIHDKSFSSHNEKIRELEIRGLAYKEAGANGIFPIALKNKDDIKELVIKLKIPVNILTIPGIPDFGTLQEIGVRRLSLGPSFLKIAVKAMKTLAFALKDHKGLSTITENEITTEYLKQLINN